MVLLRAQGVPARFVKGLTVGPQTDQGGGLHVVRESDAHAWVEAWVPGEGWVEVDPTPPGQFATAPAGAGSFTACERLRAALASAWTRLVARAGGLRALARRESPRGAGRAVRSPLAGVAAPGGRRPRPLASCGPALATATAPPPPRDSAAERPRRPARARSRARAALGRLAAAPARPGRGLLEHARPRVGRTPPLALPAPLAAAGREVVAAYYRARFGGEPPDAGVTARLRQGLREP